MTTDRMTWISVKGRRPEEMERVLVWLVSEEFTGALIAELLGGNWFIEDDGGLGPGERITHWAPLLGPLV